MSGTWPPSDVTATKLTLPAYPYVQYSDDDNVRAFFDAFNLTAQEYLDWFNTHPLACYTNTNISGNLLDWTATGIYGLGRPALPTGAITTIGPIDTWAPGEITPADSIISGAINYYVASDDIYRRALTWHFFKGDGQNFSIPWLKRRIIRFLTGINGVADNIGETYQVSVTFTGPYEATITITLETSGNITLASAQTFQSAIAAGVLELPFQWTFLVDIVNNLGATGLTNVAGVLNVTDLTGWPTSATGLPLGAVWSDSAVVTVVPGITPDPYAVPLFFGLVTSGELLAIGGGNLPTSNPGIGTMQLWNDANVVKIA
jgi:hypothetical protein